MKKFIAIGLVVAMLFSATSCDFNSNSQKESNNKTKTSFEEVDETADGVDFVPVAKPKDYEDFFRDLGYLGRDVDTLNTKILSSEALESNFSLYVYNNSGVDAVGTFFPGETLFDEFDVSSYFRAYRVENKERNEDTYPNEEGYYRCYNNFYVYIVEFKDNNKAVDVMNSFSDSYNTKKLGDYQRVEMGANYILYAAERRLNGFDYSSGVGHYYESYFIEDNVITIVNAYFDTNGEVYNDFKDFYAFINKECPRSLFDQEPTDEKNLANNLPSSMNDFEKYFFSKGFYVFRILKPYHMMELNPRRIYGHEENSQSFANIEVSDRAMGIAVDIFEAERIPSKYIDGIYYARSENMQNSITMTRYVFKDRNVAEDVMNDIGSCMNSYDFSESDRVYRDDNNILLATKIDFGAGVTYQYASYSLDGNTITTVYGFFSPVEYVGHKYLYDVFKGFYDITNAPCPTILYEDEPRYDK